MKLALLFIFIFAQHVSGKELNFTEYLNIAWQNHPLFKIEKLQEEQNEELTDSAKARYMPHLSLEAVDTKGFPGSTSTLHLGGLVGSAYRKGMAGGIVWDQLIYDFGRTSALLKKYKASNQLEEATLARDKYLFIIKMASLFLNCAKSEALQQSHQRLLRLVQLIYNETTKMTHTGQKSIVDQSLTQNDLDELKREIEDQKLEKQQILDEMFIYAQTENFQCTRLNSYASFGSLKQFQVQSPQVLLAKAQADIFQAQAQEYKSNQRPTINAVGSYGAMEDSRVVPKENYSAGIGIVFPFFNGGEDAHKAKLYKLKAEAQIEELKIAKLEFQIHEKSLTQKIYQLKRDLQGIEIEYNNVNRTTDLALKRYLRLQGTLIDVRESFKRLKALEIEKLKKDFELASYVLDKELLIEE